MKIADFFIKADSERNTVELRKKFHRLFDKKGDIKKSTSCVSLVILLKKAYQHPRVKNYRLLYQMIEEHVAKKTPELCKLMREFKHI